MTNQYRDLFILCCWIAILAMTIMTLTHFGVFGKDSNDED